MIIKIEALKNNEIPRKDLRFALHHFSCAIITESFTYAVSWKIIVLRCEIFDWNLYDTHSEQR